MKNTNKVIIIPVNNQLPYLQRCIDSVIKFTKNPFIIVIDDGSTDDATSKWILDNEKIIGYKRIYHDKAMGFSKACNDGIDYAMEHCDFTCLCLLNSDTEVETDGWFDIVERHYLEGDNIGIAGVMSDNALAQTVKNKAQYMEKIANKPTVYSYLIHGFCYFISRDLIMNIGKLDEISFPHYGSEDDYSLKALRAGYKNLLVGSVFVHHNNETSYSHDVRARMVKHTLPQLTKRWGRGLVDKYGTLSLKAGQYINNK